MPGHVNSFEIIEWVLDLPRCPEWVWPAINILFTSALGISKEFTWPGMSQDIKSFVNSWKTCQFNARTSVSH